MEFLHFFFCFGFVFRVGWVGFGEGRGYWVIWGVFFLARCLLNWLPCHSDGHDCTVHFAYTWQLTWGENRHLKISHTSENGCVDNDEMLKGTMPFYTSTICDLCGFVSVLDLHCHVPYWARRLAKSKFVAFISTYLQFVSIRISWLIFPLG